MSDDELVAITADVKPCPHQYVFMASCPHCYAELQEKYDRLANFLKEEIRQREYVCTTNHAVLLDRARELLKELEA